MSRELKKGWQQRSICDTSVPPVEVPRLKQASCGGPGIVTKRQGEMGVFKGLGAAFPAEPVFILTKTLKHMKLDEGATEIMTGRLNS